MAESLVNITLPDGSVKSFSGSVTVATVAADISNGLAKAALAGKVNDTLVDTSFEITTDCQLQIITAKDQEGLDVIRHSAAHLMAQAVKELYPTAQVTIGPVIENGFYYDFDYERSFTPDDLKAIEKKMKHLVKQGDAVSRREISRNEAIEYFRGIGEEYKALIIEDIPEDEVLTLYTQGEFTDLCRGPHVPNTRHIKAFKLTKLAGAYWRGDSNNEMLQRIYGTAWPDKQALNDYLERIAEAEKRDHRKLAKQLDLFHLQEEAPGMVFWHDNGWLIYRLMENYMRTRLRKAGYQEIKTPQLLDKSLWEKSGHWGKYKEEMFITESEKHEFALKPMNCPGHVQVFNQGLKSYRDLPLRFAEFGNCHRNEHSGTLHGLMRVRNLTQDDAHIFCTEDQIFDEIKSLIDLVFTTYQDFGLDDITCNLSTRPPKRVGSESTWDKAEAALEQVLNESGLQWQLQPEDGAFYGPKIDFTVHDCLGRSWQCGTIQLDFSMPERLGAEYVAEDGSRQRPVMIHRAILGSLERFMGILIEHYAGYFPLWLSPVQVVVMNITDKQADYAIDVAESLKNRGFRANLDLRNEKIGFKIRTHTLQHVPYQLIIGDKELENNSLSVRRCNGDDLGSMSIDQLTEILSQDMAIKSQTVTGETSN